MDRPICIVGEPFAPPELVGPVTYWASAVSAVWGGSFKTRLGSPPKGSKGIGGSGDQDGVPGLVTTPFKLGKVTLNDRAVNACLSPYRGGSLP